jgi:hypothetical protein
MTTQHDAAAKHYKTHYKMMIVRRKIANDFMMVPRNRPYPLDRTIPEKAIRCGQPRRGWADGSSQSEPTTELDSFRW